MHTVCQVYGVLILPCWKFFLSPELHHCSTFLSTAHVLVICACCICREHIWLLCADHHITNNYQISFDYTSTLSIKTAPTFFSLIAFLSSVLYRLCWPLSYDWCKYRWWCSTLSYLVFLHFSYARNEVLQSFEYRYLMSSIVLCGMAIIHNDNLGAC